MWTHYVARELQPDLLEDIPPHATTNGSTNTITTTTSTAATTTDDEEDDHEFDEQNVKVIKTTIPEDQNVESINDIEDSNDDSNLDSVGVVSTTIPSVVGVEAQVKCADTNEDEHILNVLQKNGENGNHTENKLSPSSSPLPPTSNGNLIDKEKIMKFNYNLFLLFLGVLLDISCNTPATNLNAATLKIDESSTTTTTTTRSDDDDSIDNNKSITPIIVANDETNDSDSQSSAKR
jgi:hypothetical protein